MSIMYCFDHDHRWDSDFHEDCPLCERDAKDPMCGLDANDDEQIEEDEQ